MLFRSARWRNLVLSGPSGADSSVASEHTTSTPDSYMASNWPLKIQAGAVAGLGFLAFIALCAAAEWTPTMTGAGADSVPATSSVPAGSPDRARKVVDDLRCQLL
jgi:hypothetical protein